MDADLFIALGLEKKVSPEGATCVEGAVGNTRCIRLLPRTAARDTYTYVRTRTRTPPDGPPRFAFAHAQAIDCPRTIIMRMPGKPGQVFTIPTGHWLFDFS